MRVIYTAGPYRSDTTWGVVQNIRKAEQAAIKLWQEGWACICPHLNSQLFDKGGICPPDVFLEGGLEILKRCDAIYMMSEYLDSEGAMKELELAQKLNLEIIYE